VLLQVVHTFHDFSHSPSIVSHPSSAACPHFLSVCAWFWVAYLFWVITRCTGAAALQPSIVQPHALYLASLRSLPSQQPWKWLRAAPCIPDSGISGVIRDATTASHPGPNAAPSQHPQEVSPAANRCRTAAGVAQQAQVATAVVQWLKTPPVLGVLSLIPRVCHRYR
jgi:hypothetical protein